MECVAPSDDDLWARSIDCRYRNLYQPYDLPRSCALSELDEPRERPETLHRVMLVAGEVAATGRLDLQPANPAGSGAQLRYCAVEPKFRGRGVGQALVRSFEEEARARGLGRVWMEARVAALNFYLRLGYTDIGEGPLKWGLILHRVLEKRLDEDPLTR